MYMQYDLVGNVVSHLDNSTLTIVVIANIQHHRRSQQHCLVCPSYSHKSLPRAAINTYGFSSRMGCCSVGTAWALFCRLSPWLRSKMAKHTDSWSYNDTFGGIRFYIAAIGILGRLVLIVRFW